MAGGLTGTVESLVGVSTGGCEVETGGCAVGVLDGLLLLAGVVAEGCFEDEETGLDGLTGPVPSPFSS